MNLNINLVLLCILAFAAYDLAKRPRKRFSRLNLLIGQLQIAVRLGAFGPPRIKKD